MRFGFFYLFIFYAFLYHVTIRFISECLYNNMHFLGSKERFCIMEMQSNFL